MKKYLLAVSMCAILCLGIHKTNSQKKWLQENTVELATDNGYDFEAIRKAIGDKRIIAIGESSHGLAEYFKLKSALIIYLHKELNFEVFAMEAGLGDVNLAYSNIDTLSVLELRDHSVFGNFRVKEAIPLFEYIKNTSTTENPLIYTGYDTQSSSHYGDALLKKLIQPFNQQLSDSIHKRFKSYYGWAQALRNNDSINYYIQRDIFINTSNEISAILVENENEIKSTFKISDFQHKMLLKMLEGYRKSTHLDFNNRYQYIALRDEIMAENITWILNSLYPNKKIVIWGHNGHVENSKSNINQYKMMGHYLKETFKKDYYSLGLFAYKGETYNHWTQKIIPFENSDSTFIEKKMIDTQKKISFLNLRKVRSNKNTAWLFNSINGFEMENGGAISFIPSKRFDGIVTFYTSGAPTYD